jgi:dienelactone hydrolase
VPHARSHPLAALAFGLALAVPAVAAASDACDGSARGATAPPIVQPGLFTYDAGADLGVQVVGTRPAGAATVTDLTFVAQPARPTERVAAYVVAPARGGTGHAGVVWVHWLGDPKTTNRTEFLDEATALAARGVVSVLVDTMWAKPRWYRDRVLEQDQASYAGQVVALRRALDLLIAQPGVDPARVAMVGHDYGGMHGAILAGVDRRAKTQVIVAATASFLDWAFFYGKAPVSKETYLKQHESLSICDHLAAAKTTSVFFQFAEKDEYVTPAKAQALFAAAAGPKQMSVYGGAGHDMAAPAAIRADRTAWLARELGLK